MARVWYVTQNGKTHGPFLSVKLRELAGSGRLSPTARIANSLNGPWHSVADVRGLEKKSKVGKALVETPPTILQGSASVTAKEQPVSKGGLSQVVSSWRVLLARGIIATGVVLFGLAIINADGGNRAEKQRQDALKHSIGVQAKAKRDAARAEKEEKEAKAKAERKKADLERRELEGDIHGAWAYTQIFVEKNLKSPSTAKFPFGGSRHATHLGDGLYRVTSYVDSQNGFGAMLRSDFEAEIQKTDTGWKLVSLEFFKR